MALIDDPLILDGTGALAFVIIRRDPDNPYGVLIDGATRGISRRQASILLRQLADKWEADPT